MTNFVDSDKYHFFKTSPVVRVVTKADSTLMHSLSVTSKCMVCNLPVCSGSIETHWLSHRA